MFCMNIILFGLLVVRLDVIVIIIVLVFEVWLWNVLRKGVWEVIFGEFNNVN